MKKLKNADELIALADRVGILPYFDCGAGLSVWECTNTRNWWTDTQADPWVWREVAARSRKVVYSKLFGGKAGFVSLRLFPDLANIRRDGYDFDARYEDGLAKLREKRIMDCFDNEPFIPSHVLKSTAGFGKGGEKNFPGIVTGLMMQCYLVTADFAYKVSKKGEKYGMPVCVYARPEDLWDMEGYDVDISVSRARLEKALTPYYDDNVIELLISGK